MSLRIADSTDTFVSPLNGVSPVAISKSRMPSEKTSERAIDRLALRLLGRHVGDRADDAAFDRELLPGHRRRQVVARRVLAQLREAEVQHLDAALVADHHVAGLQVAMRDAPLVGRADRVGQRDRELQQLLERHALRAG